LTPVIVPVIPERTPSVISDNSECREGYTLVYRFTHKDTFCTSPSTASTWERLGLAEIVKNSISVGDDEPVEDQVDLPSENLVETIELPPEEEPEIVMEEESEFVEEIPRFSNDSDDYPMIRQIEENIWHIVDYDGSSGFLIEGDKGIIVINSLSSRQSTDKIIDEFQKISDKKIKAVILTNINSEILFAVEAYVEKSDGVLDIIISEYLLQHYETTSNSKVENTIPFSSSLSVDIIGVNLELLTNDRNDSFQTVIHIPDYGQFIPL
jgi:hypothetical protein